MANGKARVTFNIPLAKEVANEAAERGVRAATIEAQRVVQVDILSSSPARHGREYARGRDKVHVASAPGESPAPDTGHLRETIGTEFVRGSVAHGKVFSNLEKAAALELGTEKIAPRPFLSRVAPEFGQRIFAAFVRAARR